MKLRFAIRDWLWLILVFALAIGWWLDHHAMLNYKLYYLDRSEQERLYMERMNYGPQS